MLPIFRFFKKSEDFTKFVLWFFFFVLGMIRRLELHHPDDVICHVTRCGAAGFMQKPFTLADIDGVLAAHGIVPA